MAVSVAASGTKTMPLGTCTITDASPAVVTYAAHGLSAGDAVVFASTGALPTGLTAGTTYYVISPTTNTFEVSATSGGSAINTSSAGSGTQSVIAESIIFQTTAIGTYEFEADLSAMASGDQVVLSIYKTVLSGGASSVLYQQAFIGSQKPTAASLGGINSVPPLTNVSGEVACSIPANTGLTTTGALGFTVSQILGTARAIPWSINRFA
jgi:hypothetical protein